MRQLEDTKHTLRVCAYQWRHHVGDLGSPLNQINNKIMQEAQLRWRVSVLTTDLEAVRRMRDYKVDVRIPHDTLAMHTKAFVFDEGTLLIGSHNMTRSAFTQNRECSVLITDYEVVQQFVKYFDTLFSTYASS